jgi:hypothetical protein
VQPTRCHDEPPPLRPIPLEGVDAQHVAACHWVEQIERGEIQPRASGVPAAAP